MLMLQFLMGEAFNVFLATAAAVIGLVAVFAIPLKKAAALGRVPGNLQRLTAAAVGLVIGYFAGRITRWADTTRNSGKLTS